MTVTINGTTGVSLVEDASITNSKLSLSANASNIATALNASGSAPIYACRAWVNFNGTGTVAIRASGNVSSITDLGTGNYRANFTTALPDANYTATTQATNGTGIGVDDQRCFTSTPSGSYLTSSLQVGIVNGANNAFQDASVINVAIFR